MIKFKFDTIITEKSENFQEVAGKGSKLKSKFKLITVEPVTENKREHIQHYEKQDDNSFKNS